MGHTMAVAVDRKLTVEERTGLDTYDFGRNDFITVDTEICRTCETKPCLYVCPAKVYKLDEKGELIYNTEGCMELGACTIVCRHIGKGAIKWSYPEGGKGITYRFG
jgi:ferredoxin like protein